MKELLHGMIIIGDLLAGGLNTSLALFINGSSFSPKFLIVMPKAQRAMTSIVKALKCLDIK